MSNLYNCEKCPAYCCGYPIIATTAKDIRRLAKHFALSFDKAREKFTEKENNRVRKLKQRHDKKFNSPVCMFLNQKTRQCGVYQARPQICRDYPGDRCEWHDRNLLESIGQRKVILLKVMPWTIDSEYPSYTAKKLPQLVQAYANGGRGKMPIKRKTT